MLCDINKIYLFISFVYGVSLDLSRRSLFKLGVTENYLVYLLEYGELTVDGIYLFLDTGKDLVRRESLVLIGIGINESRDNYLTGSIFLSDDDTFLPRHIDVGAAQQLHYTGGSTR